MESSSRLPPPSRSNTGIWGKREDGLFPVVNMSTQKRQLLGVALCPRVDAE